MLMGCPYTSCATNMGNGMAVPLLERACVVRGCSSVSCPRRAPDGMCLSLDHDANMQNSQHGNEPRSLEFGNGLRQYRREMCVRTSNARQSFQGGDTAGHAAQYTCCKHVVFFPRSCRCDQHMYGVVEY
jgi:hypothetical protein